MFIRVVVWECLIWLCKIVGYFLWLLGYVKDWIRVYVREKGCKIKVVIVKDFRNVFEDGW